MKVIIYSHSYLEPENQKNIQALSRLASVKCVLPESGSVLIFLNYQFRIGEVGGELFCALSRIGIFGSQYVLKHFSKFIRTENPDIIVVEYNPWSCMFFQALATKLLFCPDARLICFVKKNTFVKRGLRGFFRDVFARITLSTVDHILAGSQMAGDMLQVMLSVPIDKITVCHHLGVDTDLFRPASDARDGKSAERPILIGYCGRFDAEKGVLDLVTAVESLQRSERRPIELRLLGHGAYSQMLDRKLEEQQVKCSWLSIFPPVPNARVAEFLKNLDIFVLAARTLEDHQEHDAHALLEAMACGVPCVGTTSGIIPEILGDGAGVLVPPEAPMELFSALSDLIRNDAKRMSLGRRGRIKAETEFALDVVAGGKMRVFERVFNEAE